MAVREVAGFQLDGTVDILRQTQRGLQCLDVRDPPQATVVNAFSGGSNGAPAGRRHVSRGTRTSHCG